MPWTDYTADLEWHFNPAVTTPGAAEPALQERQARSDEARRTLKMMRDLRYGPGPRQLLDFFPAGDGAKVVHLYLHGGYWRRGHKDNAAFAALPSVACGIPTAVMTYDLCPAVTLEQVVAEILDGIEWVHRNARSLGAGGDRVFLSGHSAGAHLCAMALACDWKARGLPEDVIAGAALISGIYDLGPVPQISVNEQVRLTPARVRANSPLFHLPRRPVPLLLAAGGRESAGWINQTVEYEQACRAAGHPTTMIAFPDDHHASLALNAHGRDDSPVIKAIAGILSA
jgi:arylformamidase